MTTIADTLQEVSQTVQSIENCNNSLTAVTIQDDEEAADSTVVANLTVELDLLDSDPPTTNVRLAIGAAELMASGKVRLELECLSTEEMPEPNKTVSIDTQSTGDDTAETETPRHRNPAALRDVYEECDTFSEMTAALDVDVTPETVRKQMISHGIHEVESQSDGTKNNDETKRESTERAEPVTDDERVEDMPATLDHSLPTASTDAMRSDGGVPLDLTVEEIKEIVDSSRTIREAQQYLKLDREQTKTYLQELNILDLVVGRLPKNENKNVSESELASRLPANVRRS